ncbi:response regulator transcription factor [Nakamurella multipartita]|jgi:DNA-binding response OmpR family regulator|uniref:Two component transcriptional regulator, winged helix family n=1 Tax=Nakamurella multipartita (strain ATCC 700099 / DSM 44233 / CIP 104796 / JCM 9543 / NBRC 105858 / Y-104) TaxID=479431 RepID=C8XHY5_NAKMY|nr:response regulator transcription factor [Nakamurella multipartita]ACV76476.1 two component transcriptional regulator, winged helix family [Nakamurella multipartita DSM 44233]HOZ58480.1 response regulator transcription factor [Nakamurella multipartita]
MTATGDKPRLLLVEDDSQLGPLLQEVLDEAYTVDLARDGQAGLHAGLTRDYALMVIDRGLPAIEGVDLVRRLRQRGVAAPVLILTARAAVADRVEGLDAGAQDYLVKPFEVDELLARLRALLRRTVDEATELDLGGRRLDVTGRRVVGGGQVVDLSGREAALLEVLARRPQQVFTRPQLLAAVFDPADDPGSVDTYVYYLRRKLGRDCVTTVHGVGYRLGTIS